MVAAAAPGVGKWTAAAVARSKGVKLDLLGHLSAKAEDLTFRHQISTFDIPSTF